MCKSCSEAPLALGSLQERARERELSLAFRREKRTISGIIAYSHGGAKSTKHMRRKDF